MFTITEKIRNNQIITGEDIRAFNDRIAIITILNFDLPEKKQVNLDQDSTRTEQR